MAPVLNLRCCRRLRLRWRRSPSFDLAYSSTSSTHVMGGASSCAHLNKAGHGLKWRGLKMAVFHMAVRDTPRPLHS